MRKTWMPAAAVLCAGALLASCSNNTTSDEPRAGSGGDTATTSAVDEAALDTGSYPTTPAAEFGRSTNENITENEGQRLAEFTISPWEIDPTLTSTKMPTTILRVGQDARVLAGASTGDIAATYKMLYGFVATAATNTPVQTDPSRSVVNAVLRFNTPDDAAKAAHDMHTALTTVDDGTGLQTADTISVLPNTLVSTGESPTPAGPITSVNAFTAHGDYVLYTYAGAPVAEKDWTAKSVAKAVSLQSPLIDKFPALPTKEQRGGAPIDLPYIDQDKILIYAIPEEDTDAQRGNDMAVYGPRGMSHRSTNPPLTYRVLTDTGSEHNAVAKTNVYRASDDAGAQTIVDEFSKDLTAQGFTTAPSPQGLPDATCFTKDTALGTIDNCMTVVGRYVGEASGLDDKNDVDQQISAQYLILQHADQNH